MEKWGNDETMILDWYLKLWIDCLIGLLGDWLIEWYIYLLVFNALKREELGILEICSLVYCLHVCVRARILFYHIANSTTPLSETFPSTARYVTLLWHVIHVGSHWIFASYNNFTKLIYSMILSISFKKTI